MNFDQWLTLDELASYLKISRSKIYQMSRDAEIPASKIGKQWRFNLEEIDTWMKNKNQTVLSGNKERQYIVKENGESA